MLDGVVVDRMTWVTIIAIYLAVLGACIIGSIAVARRDP